MDASKSSGAAPARAGINAEADFRPLMDAIAEGVCVLDDRARITICNRTFLEMTGYEERAATGRNVCELLHLKLAESGGVPHGCELPKNGHELGERAILHEYLLRKDGRRFPVRCWLRPWRNSSGLRHLLTVEDISELEQTKEVLDRSEQRFRQILKNAPDVAWTSDLQGHTLYISPKVEAVLGYSKEEFCSGQQLRLGRIHPGDFGRVYEAYQSLFKNQTSLDIEYRFRHKNGKWIWVQDRATTTHEEGGVLYADGFLCDITERKEAEAELQFQTAFLEAQANSTIDGILVVDPAGRTLLRNQRFAEIFQLPKELQANREEGGTMRHAAALMKNPKLFLSRVEYLYQHPNETARDELELKNGMFLDRYSSPVVDKNGVYYGRIWTFRDITESKRNQDELQQLSLAVEQSPVSVIITDPEGKIGYVNRKFTECSGYTREEVVGNNPRILKSGQTSPDLYRDLWSTVKQGRVWSGEFLNKKKNGEIFWEAASITPITNAKGQITHFLAVKEDITGRRKAERDLRLTQFSVDHASEAIQWLDAEGRIVYANDASCATLKRSRGELIGLAVTDARPVFSKEYWDKLWQELKQRNSMTFESQVQTKNGESVPVEINANYLRFDGQEYCFTFARDISERRALEAQLRQAQKLEGIGHLAAGIAHEINTPTQFVTDNLTFMQDSWKSIFELLERYRAAIREGGAGLAAAGLQEAEQSCDLEFIASEVPRAIDQSLDGARRVAKIVRAMKEFSHPDSAEKTATDLNRAIESTITVARNEWKYVSEIVTEFDDSMPAVVCFPGDINQVVLNLIVNAAHAIKDKVQEGEKGQITVRTRNRGEAIEISVQDTGSGIPAAIQGKVFDPFFTTKEVGKGTGQGLSFSYTVIVKKHGGKIWFETEVGKGTTFFVTLPTSVETTGVQN
ncbi:MAG: PAS domain S-box protein [Candidatus Sulfotelmatobacter sp.]